MRGELLSPTPAVNSESSRNIGSSVGNLGVNNEDSNSKRNDRGLPTERLRQQQQPAGTCKDHGSGAAEWNDSGMPEWKPASLLRRET